MLSLSDVLEHFPEKSFLLNMKTNSSEAVRVLINYLAELSVAERKKPGFIGDQSITEAVSDKFSEPRVYSKEIAKSCCSLDCGSYRIVNSDG